MLGAESDDDVLFRQREKLFELHSRRNGCISTTEQNLQPLATSPSSFFNMQVHSTTLNGDIGANFKNCVNDCMIGSIEENFDFSDDDGDDVDVNDDNENLDDVIVEDMCTNPANIVEKLCVKNLNGSVDLLVAPTSMQTVEQHVHHQSHPIAQSATKVDLSLEQTVKQAEYNILMDQSLDSAQIIPERTRTSKQSESERTQTMQPIPEETQPTKQSTPRSTIEPVPERTQTMQPIPESNMQRIS